MNGASPETTGVADKIGSLLRSRPTAIGLVFCLALVLRAVHFRDLSVHDPFYTIASVDGAIYDAWAREILAGEGFGDGVLFLGPLYPTFMAGVYALFGPSLPALKAVQVVLGAVSCALVYEITRRLFGWRSALVAGLASALYGQHIFYSGTVMILNLQVPLVLGIVLAAMHGLRRPGFRIWATCGLLVGFSALARQTTLLLAPILALWILFGMEGGSSFGRRFAWGTAFGIAVCAVVLPFTVRNYVVGGDLVLLNSTGGYNFYMGNQRGADGTWKLPRIRWRVRVDNPVTMRDAFTAVAERETGRELLPSEVSSYWMGRGIDEIRADPRGWMGLELRKALLFVNAAEIWNNRSKEVSSRFSRVLRLPLVEMAVIAPLALVGLALSRRRWRELLPLHATIFVYLVSSLLFFVLSRYRMPATFVLIPFAAHAAVEMFDFVREKNFRRLAVVAALLVTSVTLVHWPLVTGNRLHMAWYNLGNKYQALDRHDEAIAAYHASLDELPSAISTHNNLALAYEDGGYVDEAITRWRHVLALARKIGSGRHVERAERHLRELGAVPTPDSSAGQDDR